MASIDIRTVHFILGLLLLVIPSFTWVILKDKHFKIISLWCGSSVLWGISTILNGTRGFAFIPDYINISGSQTLALLGGLIRIKSLKMDLSIAKQQSFLKISIVTILYFSILECLRIFYLETKLNFLFHLLVGTILLSYIGWLVRKIAIQENLNIAVWMYITYFIYSLTYGARFIDIAFLMSSTSTLEKNIFIILLMFFGFMNLIIGNIGYIGIWLHRSYIKEKNEHIKKAVEEQNWTLSKQLSHLERRVSLGEMSAMISHELTQPLTTIKLDCQFGKILTESEVVDSVKVNHVIERVIHNVDKTINIIERIRNYTKPSISTYSIQTLNKIIKESVSLLEYESNKNQVYLTFDLISPSPNVYGDNVHLSQVVINILRNAIESAANSPKKYVLISTKVIDSNAVLCVRDYGIGFSDDVLRNIGTPFFSTKSGGMGLGLSISEILVNQHNGKINYQNASNGGALVELILPAH